MKNMDKALDYFSSAIDYNSTFAEAYLYRGIVKKSLGRNGDALRDYNRAILL